MTVSLKLAWTSLLSTTALQVYIPLSWVSIFSNTSAIPGCAPLASMCILQMENYTLFIQTFTRLVQQELILGVVFEENTYISRSP